MLLLDGSRLINTPVMGLQTGSELARTSRPIVNPHTLEILAYELTGPLLTEHPSLLRVIDVREFSDIGLIVDSSDEFILVSDVIKLEEVYNMNFSPIGMPVVDERHKKLGKVDGYMIETGAFLIQQLSVRRPLLQSLNDPHLIIHRTQITEITDKEIIVHSRATIPEPAIDTLRGAYTNPFRKSQQADPTDSSDIT